MIKTSPVILVLIITLIWCFPLSLFASLSFVSHTYTALGFTPTLPSTQNLPSNQPNIIGKGIWLC